MRDLPRVARDVWEMLDNGDPALDAGVYLVRVGMTWRVLDSGMQVVYSSNGDDLSVTRSLQAYDDDSMTAGAKSLAIGSEEPRRILGVEAFSNEAAFESWRSSRPFSGNT